MTEGQSRHHYLSAVANELTLYRALLNHAADCTQLQFMLEHPFSDWTPWFYARYLAPMINAAQRRVGENAPLPWWWSQVIRRCTEKPGCEPEVNLARGTLQLGYVTYLHVDHLELAHWVVAFFDRLSHTRDSPVTLLADLDALIRQLDS